MKAASVKEPGDASVLEDETANSWMEIVSLHPFQPTKFPIESIVLPLLPGPLDTESVALETMTDEAFCDRWNREYDDGHKDHLGVWNGGWSWGAGGLLSLVGLFGDA